jgi:hypothetical protein
LWSRYSVSLALIQPVPSVQFCKLDTSLGRARWKLSPRWVRFKNSSECHVRQGERQRRIRSTYRRPLVERRFRIELRHVLCLCRVVDFQEKEDGPHSCLSDPAVVRAGLDYSVSITGAWHEVSETACT